MHSTASPLSFCRVCTIQICSIAFNFTMAYIHPCTGIASSPYHSVEYAPFKSAAYIQFYHGIHMHFKASIHPFTLQHTFTLSHYSEHSPFNTTVTFTLSPNSKHSPLSLCSVHSPFYCIFSIYSIFVMAYIYLFY
jgi:hypothetical protein